MPGNIPPHLQKYVIKQNFESYSAKDHAVWRFSLRQLKSFLTSNAHESYLDGLNKTGIKIDEIPSIESIDAKLRQFGWGAIPVSGFIPPTAFMEFQSLGYLPIASEIRSLETILYTSAPDIIHEAAGHAPIIANPDFSQYLKNYAEVASKAILNKSDINLYDAIRELSDLKEHPNSTPEQINICEEKLQRISENMGSPSEASILGRMNWWTAEYGLIGDINSPRIFGAGILSSIGESEGCLKEHIKKIPLTLECINYTYDITEQQPQLFVTPSFEQLSLVLNELSKSMSYKIGGHKSIENALKSETLNTFELNSGVQISGIIEKQIVKDGKVIFVKTKGPTQISTNRQQLDNHNKEYHSQGYSTAVGTINNLCPSSFNTNQLTEMGISIGSTTSLEFDSGFSVSGKVEQITYNKKQTPILIQFSNCSVTYCNQKYFEPEWGLFDLSLGSTVTSVFGGPADTKNYGELYNFKAQTILPVLYSEDDLKLFSLYKEIRILRNSQANTSAFNTLASKYINDFSKDWLLGIELLELIENIYPDNSYKAQIISQLNTSKKESEKINTCISKGISLATHLIIN